MDGRKAYVDASIVLRRMLEQPGAMRDWSLWEILITNELMEVEVRRTLDRLRVLGEISGAAVAQHVSEFIRLTAGLERIRMGPAVLKRASGPFPAPIATLDAIHLATALLWTEDNDEALTFLTHDRQLALAARACGFVVKS